MKKKLILTAFVILTVFEMRSQDTTDVRPISFPFWMVKEIAIDLVEKQRLESNAKINLIELSKYRDMVVSLETTDRNRIHQIELLKRMNGSLEVQLKAVQEKKDPGFSWKAFFRGLVIGSLAGIILMK